MHVGVSVAQAVFIVIASVLLGSEFGYKVGFSVALLGYALMPWAPK